MSASKRRTRRGTELLPEPRHRADVQGLRAVAVLLVALNHAGVGFLGGGYIGVDVFFVLSGYLITGVLVRDAARDKHVSITEFYVRRARRILPAATLTLVTTVAASYFVLNVVRAKETFTDVMWAAVFGANVHFANVGTDYFDKERPESAVRHFWSLAVEEQFYIVWPTVVGFVLLGMVLFEKHRSHDSRHRITERALKRLTVVTVAIFVVSLVWSVLQTSDDPTSAYFSTFTRAWELALGAILATVGLRLARLGSGVRLALGWGGLAAIVAAAVLYDEATAFPGIAALLPCAGAAMVIAAGVASSEPRGAAARLLAIAPMRYVGDLSYTFYLWHWPVLVLAAAQQGELRLSASTNLVLLVAAFALSVVTFHLFENPIHRGRWPKVAPHARHNPVLAFWVVCPVIVAVAVGVGRTGVDGEIETARMAQIQVQEARDARARDEAQRKAALSAEQRAKEDAAVRKQQERSLRLTGSLPAVVRAAQAVEQGAKVPGQLTPSPKVDDFESFISPISPQCTPKGARTRSEICRMGSGKKTLVAFGDSHTQMWLPVLTRYATRRGYTVRPVMKSACSVRFWGGEPGAPPGCLDWYRWAVKQVEAIKPDVVLIGADYMPAAPGPDPAADAIRRAFADLIPKLDRTAGKVLLLGDLFGTQELPVDCLQRSGATLATCSTPYDAERRAHYRAVGTQVTSLGAGFIDGAGWFCGRSTCPVVIGNTVVYADRDHVTSTYAQEIAPVFGRRLGEALARPTGGA